MEPQSSLERILVVDDEPNLRTTLVSALNHLDYHADAAVSGRDALDQLTQHDYALMLLDIAMPGMDGTELMQRVRALGSDIGIIILTGNASIDSAITAVKAGAEEYLIKPASLNEIAQAISRVIKKRFEQRRRQQLIRTALNALREAESGSGTDPSALSQTRDDSPSLSIPPESILRVGQLRLHTGTRLVSIADDARPPMELTEGEAEILTIMLRHPNQVLSSRDLVSMAWDYNLDETEARELVRHYISRLRHKIEPTPNAPHWIHTVRDRGYILDERS